MLSTFSFQVVHRDNKTNARAGVIHTPHGDIHTPAFVPVGTQASVKSLTPEELVSLGVELFFVNTYHTYLRPGIEVIKKLGGLHEFMSCKRPIITDSGGFQVFSLGRNKFPNRHSGLPESMRKASKDGSRLDGRDDRNPQLVKITDEGVVFRSHWDGTKHIFNPENSMAYQWTLGSDIHIAFDDCTSYPVTHDKARASMERTHRWAVRSLDAHKKVQRSSLIVHRKNTSSDKRITNHYQALYGVVQGSVFEDLRRESAKIIGDMDFDGVAIGGVSVGESKKEMADALDWVCPILPEDKPRHLLGVGEIDDIFELVAHGMDTFDCVQPTRLARMGNMFVRPYNRKLDTGNQYIKQYQIDITKRVYASDPRPLDDECRCYTCRHFSRAYVHHLFRVRELLGYRLATIHNLHFVLKLTADIRGAIENSRFVELRKKWMYD